MDEEELSLIISDELYKLRVSSGESTRAVADFTGLTRQTVENIENAKYRIKIWYVYLLCSHYGIRVDTFFRRVVNRINHVSS
jgi:DNA-binding XRE family transcriptional regulator